MLRVSSLFLRIGFLSLEPLSGEDFSGSGTCKGLNVSIGGVTDLFIGLREGL